MMWSFFSERQSGILLAVIGCCAIAPALASDLVQHAAVQQPVNEQSLTAQPLIAQPISEPDLKSGSVLVMDETSGSVLLSQQANVAAPIASITKLMTALVVLEANQPMGEMIQITAADKDMQRGSSSRLAVGTRLSRADLMHLALMASENRAAHALGRRYPGGLTAMVRAMNTKAKQLGMTHTRFVDPTGLSSQNVASPEDLSLLVIATSQNQQIRSYSTDNAYAVKAGKKVLQYRNTNSLVDKTDWNILVQKTGYISEAGRCLVMKAVIAGRSVVIVLLDSVGRYTRVADAARIKDWMESKQLVALVQQGAQGLSNSY
jgi:D-alanyl-D-alanine endopeptidase (penicillin-binding protein 7)